MSRYKRKRPLRGKNKPYTVHEPETATLLQWLQTYKFMCKKPKLWFRNSKFSQSELQAVYDAGLEIVALELGYIRQPLEVLSRPIIANKSEIAEAA